MQTAVEAGLTLCNVMNTASQRSAPSQVTVRVCDTHCHWPTCHSYYTCVASSERYLSTSHSYHMPAHMRDASLAHKPHRRPRYHGPRPPHLISFLLWARVVDSWWYSGGLVVWYDSSSRVVRCRADRTHAPHRIASQADGDTRST